ncbi:ATP-binding protein [Pseudomonas sp. BW16M2]|uniref:ATP-binding protein n=1 Tax=Pseudomonas sp. BW16M2 TaxID=2745489 RepID=UPI0016463546|nr:ATP-binding protein [Pseudomonas sp. BW16M2]MBC3438062.1 ATP-binding protein [Pseudomonas sp. BW16M2]
MSTTHPLICHQAQIITPAFIWAVRLCLDRVALRRSAVMFRGQSRVGKSRCAVFVAEQLKKQFPGCHVVSHMALKRKDSRPNLCRELCYSENILPNERVELRYHIVAHVESLLAGQHAGQYVLIVDEIQKFLPIDFFILADLYNLLQVKKICMTLIAFAQPDIDAVITLIKATREKQLTARFLTEILTYPGCRGVDELGVILNAYDMGSEFPSGSGTSYTAHFIPKAFSAGFRLARVTEPLWRELSASTSGNYMNNIPMEHLCESVLNLLLSLAAKDSTSMDIDPRWISEAVQKSNLRAFCDAL